MPPFHSFILPFFLPSFLPSLPSFFLSFFLLLLLLLLFLLLFLLLLLSPPPPPPPSSSSFFSSSSSSSSLFQFPSLLTDQNDVIRVCRKSHFVNQRADKPLEQKHRQTDKGFRLRDQYLYQGLKHSACFFFQQNNFTLADLLQKFTGASIDWKQKDLTIIDCLTEARQSASASRTCALRRVNCIDSF